MIDLSHKTHLTHLMAGAAEAYGLSVDDLRGPSRKQELVRARHVAMYVVRAAGSMSFPTIAKAFGNRDHSTVMYAVEKVGLDPELLAEARLILADLGLPAVAS